MARKPFVTAVSAVVLISLVLMVAAPAGADTALPRAPLRKKPELACGSAEVEAKRMGEGPLAKAEPVLLAETNISFSTDDSYQSIRIGVFTKDLDSDSRYCTAAGEYRPDYQGNQVMCTADDVLTEAKKNILVNQLLPDAVKLHAERLKVKRSASGFIVPNFGASGGICAQFTIPAAHQSSSGVQGYDFVLYVAAGPTSGNTIAWALTCAANSAEGRPVVGMANISPRYIADDSRTVRTVTHEIAHALGFNYQQFTAAGMVGMASVRGKPSAPQLTSANVVAAGRDHFGWSGLTSVELEDEGGAGTAYSHWKRRNLKNELMAGIASIGYYTALTMAAFEDLGFYRVDYSKAEIMPWGYKAGEKLLTQKCVIGGVSQNTNLFCSSAQEDFRCTEDRLSVGHCGLGTYTTALASYYQYFSDPAVGGTAQLMDYCPVVEAFSNAGCVDGEQAALPGSSLSAESRCLDAFNGLKVNRYVNPVTAVCAKVQCDATSFTYKVQFSGQKGYVACPAGAALTPSDYSTTFGAGTVTCPSYVEMCSQVSDPEEEETSHNAAAPRLATGSLGGALLVLLALVAALL
eukprot:gene2298-biopygen1896